MFQLRLHIKDAVTLNTELKSVIMGSRTHSLMSSSQLTSSENVFCYQEPKSHLGSEFPSEKPAGWERNLEAGTIIYSRVCIRILDFTFLIIISLECHITGLSPTSSALRMLPQQSINTDKPTSVLLWPCDITPASPVRSATKLNIKHMKYEKLWCETFK